MKDEIEKLGYKWNRTGQRDGNNKNGNRVVFSIPDYIPPAKDYNFLILDYMFVYASKCLIDSDIRNRMSQ